MREHFFTSSLLTNRTTMKVWRHGKGNYEDDITHYLHIDAVYGEESDCYEITIRQEPYKSKKGKGTKVIDFVAYRKDLEGLLKMAKIKGGRED